MTILMMLENCSERAFFKGVDWIITSQKCREASVLSCGAKSFFASLCAIKVLKLKQYKKCMQWIQSTKFCTVSCIMIIGEKLLTDDQFFKR